jgi:hypothetical protein
LKTASFYAFSYSFFSLITIAKASFSLINAKYLSDKIPYILQGKFRGPLLYDIASSFQEAIFGLGCAMACCPKPIEEIHLEYTSRETPLLLQNRLDKNGIITSQEYNDIFADEFMKHRDNLEEIFKLLPSKISKRR